MRNRTIIIIATVIGISLAALLYLQLRYLDQMVSMRKSQVDGQVMQSLIHVARQMEMTATMDALRRDLADGAPIDSTDFLLLDSLDAQSLDNLNRSKEQFDSELAAHLKTLPKEQRRNSVEIISPAQRRPAIADKVKDNIRERYLYHRVLLDRVIYDMLYSASTLPLDETIDFKELDLRLNAELRNNGLNLTYHFRVTTSAGSEIYRCPDYSEVGNKLIYKQILMPGNAPANVGVLEVHFPKMRRYIMKSLYVLLPSILFTFILLGMFVVALVLIFRQKRIDEVKRDFINNMTHELKTPVASISLATQMLIDPSVSREEKRLTSLSNVIRDETKRLQLLIDKVLQTSVLEGRKAAYKDVEFEVTQLVMDATDVAEIRVQKAGGTIETDFAPHDIMVVGDKMHFANVLATILDNAIKYRSPERPLLLSISTTLKGNKVRIIIGDNGIGLKEKDARKIFDKFFRVHTGNRHDVKGFGLGLAYVKGIVENMHGTVHAESALGEGTRIVIDLPVVEVDDENEK